MKKKKNALMKKGASIYDMINVIDAKIKELSKLKTATTSTDGHELGFDLEFGAVKELGTTRGLIKAYGHILNEETKYLAAVKDLGLKKDKTPELMLCGHTASEWKEDISICIEVLEAKNNILKLNAAKHELKKNLTKEERLEESLNEVAKILK